MLDLLILLLLTGCAVIVLWSVALRARPSTGRSALRLVLFAHVAGAAVILLLVLATVLAESFAPGALGGWTVRRVVAAVVSWPVCSAVAAGMLVENAKRGRRGLFGIFGRDVL